MREETFVNYKGHLWLWLCLLLVGSLTLWYIIDLPVGGRSGASVFGYSSGVLATAFIIYLMWFGIRKRSYYAYRVSLKGWLAAHVWLGMALLIIVPLHAAFDFGLNVHTLAYLVLSLVVLSGIVGTYFYSVLPAETISNRGGGALKKRFEELAQQNEEVEKIKREGGSQFSDLIKSLDINFKPSLGSAFFGKSIGEFNQRLAVEVLSKVPDAERPQAIKAVSLLAKKHALAASIRKEILVRTKLKIWLYLHIPLSLALMVLVVVHIIAVFYFR